MRNTVERIIQDAFTYPAYMRYGYPNVTPNYSRFWKIPVKENEIEVPLCLWSAFKENSSADVLALPLYGTLPLLACTAATLVKDVQHDCLFEGGFRKLVLNKEGQDEVYYGTLGAILDKDFTPVWVCSWKIRKDSPEDFTYLQPIVRYSHSLFFKKGDLIASYLSTTLFRKLLSMTVRDPARPSERHPLSVCIDSHGLPFSLQHTETPSVSVTDEDLRRVALGDVERFFA